MDKTTWIIIQKSNKLKKEYKGGADMVFNSKIIEFRNKQQMQKELEEKQRQEQLEKQEKEQPILHELGQLAKETQEKFEQRETIIEESLYSYNQEMDQYNQLIEKYSTFDELEIGTILSNLIEDIESVKYRYQETYYSITNIQNGYKNTTTKYVRLIIAEVCMCSSYSNDSSKQNNLKDRISLGQAIILDHDVDLIDNHIKFYQANKQTHTLEEKVDTMYFPYIKDFIDYVISYRMTSKKETISINELENLRQEFTQNRRQASSQKTQNKFNTLEANLINSYYFQAKEDQSNNSMYPN